MNPSVGIARLVRIVLSRRMELSYKTLGLDYDFRVGPKPTMAQKEAIADELMQLLGIQIGDEIWQYSLTVEDLVKHVERMIE